MFNQPSASQNVLPTPLLRIPQPSMQVSATAAPPPFGMQLGTPVQILPRAMQPPQMRSVVPYSSMLAQAAPEPVFGVPLGQPSSSNIGSRRSGRRSNQGTSLVQRTRKLSLNIMVILIPRDVRLLFFKFLEFQKLNLCIDKPKCSRTGPSWIPGPFTYSDWRIIGSVFKISEGSRTRFNGRT